MSTESFGRSYRFQARSLWTIPALCIAFACQLSADTPTPTSTSISGSGLAATVSVNDGTYQIVAASQAWTFQGSAGPLQNVAVSNGTDSISAWNQIAFDHGTARTSSIRLYNNTSVVLFSTRYAQDGPNSDPFPSFSSYPQGLFTFNYSGKWTYQFGSLNSRAPWLFFDGQANAFILSPASNFMTAIGQHASDGSLQMPIDPQISTLPAGFTQSTLLVVGTGINSTFELWGQTITSLTGKHRAANDANVLLNQLSY